MIREGWLQRTLDREGPLPRPTRIGDPRWTDSSLGCRAWAAAPHARLLPPSSVTTRAGPYPAVREVRLDTECSTRYVRNGRPWTEVPLWRDVPPEKWTDWRW